MTTTLEPERDLRDVEERARARLDAEAGLVEADLDRAADVPERLEEAPTPLLRTAIAVTLPVFAAALMVGGVFAGASGRVYACVAGVLGVALATFSGRLRKPSVVNLVIIVGAFLIGLLMVVPSGFGNVTSLRVVVARAIADGDVLRPPVPMRPGWAAIIGWLMGLVGFGAGWIANTLRKGALGLLVPLPIAAVAAISVPDRYQIPSGIVGFVLFVTGLALLSAAAQSTASDDEKPPLSYELRRAVRSIPLVGLVVILLVVAAQTSFLFPETLIDPAQEPQRPKTTPLSEVEDRVLFEVDSSISGPWRIGNLDVYDGTEWRLPPFAAEQLVDVPASGVVNNRHAPAIRADFTIRGLAGTVLPGLSNTVGIVAEGPRLAYDTRSGNIRVAQGQVEPALQYSVVAASLPSVEDLSAIAQPLPDGFDDETYLSMPPAPPAVRGLLDQAAALPSLWERFDFVRNYVLENVTSTGTGQPAPVPPSRVQDMLAGSQEGSPFEIVAVQAMLARWLGIPSRIGYGFDGGEVVDDHLEVRPKHGATFVEVYFPVYEWLPVVGTPRKAKPTVGSDPGEQRVDPSVLPSDEVSIELFLPLVTPPESVFAQQVLRAVLILTPLLALAGLAYVLFPAVVKFRRRSRRRDAAIRLGARARVALAYAEWRDYATDFGFSYPTDTPLGFLDRFLPDPEHTELAWLVTRVLWGDLQDDVDMSHAQAAEELSRTLRQRLASAQPATVRAVAFVSRLSLRRPYAPLLNSELNPRKERQHAHAAP